MRLLLDTTVLVDVMRGKGDGYRMLSGLMPHDSSLATSVINVAEVHAGLREGEEARASRLIESLDVLPVTRAIAQRSGELVRTWASKGRTLALDDMLIAATAIEHNLPLATSNRKDFPMPEVELYPLS